MLPAVKAQDFVVSIPLNLVNIEMWILCLKSNKINSNEQMQQLKTKYKHISIIQRILETYSTLNLKP